jgi:hypothetical protein
MKNYSVFALGVLMLLSCSKENLDEEKGCIEIIKVPASKALITTAQADTANLLLSSSGYDYTQFRYIMYSSVKVNDPDPVNYKSIVASQYINGLPVFGNIFAFSYRNDTLYKVSGHLAVDTTINTSAHLNPAQLRKRYMDDTRRNNYINYPSAVNCLEAEFGYFNTAPYGQPVVLIKAWKITPKGYNYPQGIYRDDNGNTIDYYALTPIIF